jgi:beta-glucanase (GH16 family)
MKPFSPTRGQKTIGQLLFAISLFVLTANGLGAADWKLVWSDEFNYHGLPDTNKWDYEEGFIRNHESQYYTRSRLENARVEHGHLVIECRKEHFTPANHAPVEYTAASLITLNKASWQYGRIEVRAKIPRGLGVWPAIWTLGTNITINPWPNCGEIDIMEFIGKDPQGIHANAHFAVDGKHKDDSGTLNTKKPYAGYHIYAIEWTPEKIDYYFDQTKYHTVLLEQAMAQDGYNAFRAPQYLILNFALGGGWGGKIDDKILPQKFLIDYVRVYQSRNNPPSASIEAK